MKLFLQNKCKIFERWGLRPQTQGLRRLGALSPNPQPPAAGGFAPRPTKQPSPLQISGYAPVCDQKQTKNYQDNQPWRRVRGGTIEDFYKEKRSN